MAFTLASTYVDTDNLAISGSYDDIYTGYLLSSVQWPLLTAAVDTENFPPVLLPN